jgi:hypothetical protein
MKKILCLTLVFLIGTGTVNAGCTKPSGSYSATFAGSWIDTNTGSVIAITSTTSTVTFASNGSATGLEVGKRVGLFGTGQYSNSFTVPAIASTGNHTFDTLSCRGYFTTNNGNKYVYVMSNSGANLSGTYYTNDNYLFASNVLFVKN